MEELGGLYALCGGALWFWSSLLDRLCEQPCRALDVKSHGGEGRWGLGAVILLGPGALFLVACTRLYEPLCWLVGLSVGLSL